MMRTARSHFGFGFGSGLLAVLVSVVSIACGGSSDVPPSQLNLDRPVDISFACYGGLRITNGAAATVDQDVTITAQPTSSCDFRSGASETTGTTPAPPGQESLSASGGITLPGTAWYGFILQSAPGTVALATFPTKPSASFSGADVNVIDADPLTPGKNSISVGEDPIAITTDQSGCFEVIANAGSCDMSELDVASALDTDPAVIVNRVPVVNKSGVPILAKPASMVADNGDSVIGAECVAEPTGTFYVTYPACHLVAAIQMQNGVAQIVGGIDLSSGVPTVLPDGDVTCPAECGGGGTFTAGPRPVAVDLKKTTAADRLVIGSDNSSAMTLVELDKTTQLPVSARNLALEDTTSDGSMGVTAVALTPQIGMGGSTGTINDDIASGGQFQFVYATASDNSVRVYDILNNNAECDTQIDPRLIDGVTSVHDLSCFPVGLPTTPARRPGAVGPGIRLPIENGFRWATANSVQIFRGDALDPDARVKGPDKMVGYFAVVTATTGQSFVIDIDNDDYPDIKPAASPLEVNLSLAIAHHLRDAVPDRNLTADSMPGDETTRLCDNSGPDPDSQNGNQGGSRATDNPTRTIPSGVIAAEKTPNLPYLRQVLCTGSDVTQPVTETTYPASDAVRDVTYPDLIALRDEQITLTYEGTLSLDSSATDTDGPIIRVASIGVDTSGMHLRDDAKPFCDAGVEPWDIVQLRGCDPAQGDAQCPLGYSCYVHPSSLVAGLGACIKTDEADRLAESCKDFLTSSRRYTVGRSETGQLSLLPRRRLLYTTPLDGCTDTNQCNDLADYAAQQTVGSHPMMDTAVATHSYTCMADPDRPPLDGIGQTGKRCIETCDSTHACTVGGICRVDPGSGVGQCFEGVIPPQSCVNAPQRFDLRAAEAFTIVGSQSGYVHATIKDPSSDKCIRDPKAHPFVTGRIPLQAPPCASDADPRTGRRPDGSFGPNPCEIQLDDTETVPNYADLGTCALNDPDTTIVTTTKSQIEVRLPGVTLHMADPVYPGDASCNHDRMGTLNKVPLVFANYQLSWRQAAGLVPYTLIKAANLPASQQPVVAFPAFPAKVVHGPTESIWIVDEGDYLSTDINLASTRGKVYRIETLAPAQINILQ
ncbi:MAG TPA: hypothetical protein VGM90_23070 [Kofleriaceae bacterium]|jgi:hypothetical protein